MSKFKKQIFLSEKRLNQLKITECNWTGNNMIGGYF